MKTCLACGKEFDKNKHLKLYRKVEVCDEENCGGMVADPEEMMKAVIEVLKAKGYYVINYDAGCPKWGDLVETRIVFDECVDSLPNIPSSCTLGKGMHPDGSESLCVFRDYNRHTTVAHQAFTINEMFVWALQLPEVSAQSDAFFKDNDKRLVSNV